MKSEVQVHHSHYTFEGYYTKGRWASLWHQVDEIVRVNPANLLEIGTGAGLLQGILHNLGISLITLDIDVNLRPTVVGHAESLPFPDNSFDMICAFQVLEHLHYDIAIDALAELGRVSRGHVVISLPDARHAWAYRIHIPLFGTNDFLINEPWIQDKVHVFDGQHYWELNKRGYGLEKFKSDIPENLLLVNTYRVLEYPYHRFFVLRCGNGSSD